MPIMAVFNNLVMFDSKSKQNSLDTHRARAGRRAGRGATTARQLTFKLRQGVKWHDGKPFTAADVKCTWDLLPGKAEDKLRINPRKAWYSNLEEVTANGDCEVDLPCSSGRSRRSRAARLRLLAGLSVPCRRRADAHQADRHRPVQVRRVQAERVHQAGARTRTTGSRAGPISTASSTRIIPNRSTAILAFIAGKFDMTFPST